MTRAVLFIITSFALLGQTATPPQLHLDAAGLPTAGLLSEPGPTFRISDNQLASPLKLITYGDTRFTDPANTTATDPRVRRWLVSRIAEEHPAAVILNGDVPLAGDVKNDYQVFKAETQPWRDSGYNVWYSRDEFRYLWKKMSGDLTLAADATFPNPQGYDDRKAMLVIRQNLDDDSKEAIVGEHGTGMIHLAQRPEKNALMTDEQFRFGGTLAKVKAKRIGIEKHGDDIAMFISLKGEPMHQFGPPITLHFDEPFYVGIGFCSHLPDKSDAAVLSDVILENSAGKVH